MIACTINVTCDTMDIIELGAILWNYLIKPSMS
jgi:hypothetical protein